MARRRCQGKTKAGKRCRAYPLHGAKLCLAHTDEKTREKVGFGGAQEGAGRPRNPRVVDVLREWVEEHAQELLSPYVDGLRSTVLVRVRVDGEDEAVLTELPDIELRQKTAERLQDRVYGKPRQTIEHAGPESGPAIAVEFTLDETVREAIGSALRQRPAAAAD